MAAKILKRNSIGIDISEEAIDLIRNTIENPVVSESAVLNKGLDSFCQHSPDASDYLFNVDYIPVHRNKGIDGLLRNETGGIPVFIRVQRKGESVYQSMTALKKASRNKGKCKLVVIATNYDLLDKDDNNKLSDVKVIKSTSLAISEFVKSIAQ